MFGKYYLISSIVVQSIPRVGNSTRANDVANKLSVGKKPKKKKKYETKTENRKQADRLSGSKSVVWRVKIHLENWMPMCCTHTLTGRLHRHIPYIYYILYIPYTIYRTV